VSLLGELDERQAQPIESRSARRLRLPARLR
jgi:hypothetical protein